MQKVIVVYNVQCIYAILVKLQGVYRWYIPSLIRCKLNNELLFPRPKLPPFEYANLTCQSH